MRNGLPFRATAVFGLLAAISFQATAAVPDFSTGQAIYSQFTGGTPEVAVTTQAAVVSFGGCQASPSTYCPATLYKPVNGLWAESARLQPDANEPAPATSIVNAGLNDGFGASIAISADGKTAFVGDPMAACSGDATKNCGVVDVYIKPAGGWKTMTPTAQITVSTTDRTLLGGRMLMNGSTLFVIGSTPCAVPGSACGTVYVFNEPAGGWATTGQTPAASLVATDGFGLQGGALAYDATTSTLAACFGASEVYVFQGSSGSFTSGAATATLESSAGFGNLIHMGDALSISGNVIVAGGPGSSGDSSGLVVLWAMPSGGWVDTSMETALLSPSFPSSLSLTLQTGTGVLIDGNTVYAATADGAIYIYQEPAGGWASENESSQIAGGTNLLEGGPMTQSGTSLVETASDCNPQSDACIPAIIFPAPTGASLGSAPIFAAGSFPVPGAQHSTSSIPVVLAGTQVEFDYDIFNLGQVPAGGLKVSFSAPAGTSGYSSDSGKCTASGSTTTCPAGTVSADTDSGVAVMFTSPPKRITFTIAATLTTTSANWDPLDNQGSIQAISDNPPVVPSDLTLNSNNGNTLNGSIHATDADGDALHYVQGSTPLDGTLSFGPNGTYTYTPSSPTFVGTDGFSYSVSDGLLTVVGQVTINLNQPVSPPPPTGGGGGTTVSGAGSGGGGSESLVSLALLGLLRRSRNRSRRV